MGEVMTRVDTRVVPLGTFETLLGATRGQTPGPMLSDVEAEILLLITAGKQAAEIAAAVGTNQADVKDHIKAILRKAIDASGQVNRSTMAQLHSSDRPMCEMLSPFTA